MRNKVFIFLFCLYTSTQTYMYNLSMWVSKPTIWVPTRSNTNRAVQSQKMVRGLKFWIKKVEKLHYPYSENKGADQLYSYCEADLHLCFCLCRLLVFPCGGLICHHICTKTKQYSFLYANFGISVKARETLKRRFLNAYGQSIMTQELKNL